MATDPFTDESGMIQDEYRIECSVEGLSLLANLYNFKIHGDTATEIDLEFPDIRRASSFVESFQDHGWQMRLRDAVTRFDQTVTVIITKWISPVRDHGCGCVAPDGECDRCQM